MKYSTVLLSTTSMIAALFAVSTLSSCGADLASVDADLDGINPYQNFRGGEVRGESNFANLINNHAQGVPATGGWAGPFWPYTANGIATGSYAGAGSSGSSSPAGRYDAARGRTTHAQDWEVKQHGASVPNVQGWWGHCNGWCVASALFPEPREEVKVNGVSFGMGDLKAILSEAGMSASADFFGNRLDPWTREYQKAMDDTVADQYFLVLTNYMGKLKHPVLIDRFTTDQIWNQPLAGYRFKYPAKSDYLGCTGDASRGQVCKINLSSTVWWYNDSGVPADAVTPEFKWQDETDPRTGATVIEHRDLELEVWVDGPIEWDAEGKKILKSGNVIVTRDGEYFVGGAWKNGSTDYSDGHPDYMWVPYSMIAPDPNDDYANPHIDIEWVKKHLLVPGGADDPSVRPGELEPAPSPRPSQRPTQTPTSGPTTDPVPIPFPTFTGGPGNPRPDPVPVPVPGPGGGGGGPSFPFPGEPGGGGSGGESGGGIRP